MPDNDFEEVRETLSELTAKLERLNRRIEEGEDVATEELEIVALEAVRELESLNAQLREVVGPVSKDDLIETARGQMNEEEFAAFLKDHEALEAYRRELES